MKKRPYDELEAENAALRAMLDAARQVLAVRVDDVLADMRLKANVPLEIDRVT